MIKVRAHTCYLGKTGYSAHARNFFRELSNHVDLRVRNYTWDNDTSYLNFTDFSILDQITLRNQDGNSSDYHISHSFPNLPWKNNDSNFESDIDIVLMDVGHEYFYEEYNSKIKIAYTVWETTELPDHFFKALLKFDYVWVPSEWQRKCTIEQGIPESRVKVVPEGVEVSEFFPLNNKEESNIDSPFKFLLVGRWEYRKYTKEIIKAFSETFSYDDNVELLINVANPFANDGLQTTQQRLERFQLNHPKIKVVDHLPREEYIRLIRECDVFVSCARSEGWNLPLIEAMSSGIPSIYSNWGAQLQFAENKGIPVRIVGEVPASVENNESWNPSTPGNFIEPDFDDLKIKLRDSYENFKSHKEKALNDSEDIRERFKWENAAKIAKSYLDYTLINKKNTDDFVWITCGNLNYMPVIQKLAESLLEFSDRKIIVYGIECEIPFSLPNVISRTLNVPYHSEHDKWYWKQYACIESLSEGFENYVWLDGDIIANYNIDQVNKYFNFITNYPIPDIHLQSEFIANYIDSDGSKSRQTFNELLNIKHNVNKIFPIAHICMYVYNKNCNWFFQEIIEEYKRTPLNEYPGLLQWNDEGIDNLLRAKYNLDSFLPVSNFDVSSWDGEILGNSNKAMEHFISFWREEGPKNFGQLYGWQYIPKNKSNILYFHGNKNVDFAQVMIDYIKSRRDNNFFDSGYFFVGKNEIKNLSSIKGLPGSTLDIAAIYGWDYAIYHEIYNLKDYSKDNVGVRPGDTVVDLGGNIGIFTRYAYQNGAEKIVTFEPDRRYFQILKQNSPDNAILFNAAISNEVGKMTLTESSHLGGSNLWHPNDPSEVQYPVNTYTLDYILESGLIEKIDFLKVDIEGSEIIALKGISDANLYNIRNIVVEYHHQHLKYDENVRREFISRLNRLGFNSHILFCGNDNALQLIYFWK